MIITYNDPLFFSLIPQYIYILVYYINIIEHLKRWFTMNVENKNDAIWKVWNFDICEDICYVKGFDLMEKITVKTKLNTSQRTDEVPTGIKIVESLEDFLEWYFYRKSFNRKSLLPNFIFL